MFRPLPIESILAAPPTQPELEEIGRSRQGRPIGAWRGGDGPLAVSLLGGCHADEPVGPAMLERLIAWLAGGDGAAPWRAAATWSIVPHANPDGAAANAGWTGETVGVTDHRGDGDRGFDLAAYARRVVREAPGDDVEFGFPRSPDDDGARPENRAVAAWMAAGGPFDLHGSLHGMGFAPGPWFLIEASWAERTGAMRRRLRRRVRAMGYPIFDPDRGGEKGFTRIDEGFTTRPDSRAMRRHFLDRDEPEIAALFRPSSMEHARSLGGDPFTFVSEMPLFLLPPPGAARTFPDPATGTEGRLAFHRWLAELVGGREAADARSFAAEHGLRPMPIRDQMRLQLALLNEALATVGEERRAAAAGRDPG